MATLDSTPRPGLSEILGRLSDALALVIVAHRALCAREVAGEEEVVLRQGIAALNAVYVELDAVSRL